MSLAPDQFAKAFSAVIISTDLETDDLITLLLLEKYLSKSIPKLFLVGEGDSYIKYMRMKIYIEIMGFQNATVVQGYSSDKDFSYDGEDVFNVEFVKQLRVAGEKKKETKCLEEIKQFLKTNPSLTILSLKPPHEFMALWKEDNKIFNTTDLLGYMGFNIRCLMKSNENTTIIEFLNSFRRVVYYESFLATGNENSIKFKDDIFPFDKLPKYVTSMMNLWNLDMLTYCYNNIKKYTSMTVKELIRVTQEEEDQIYLLIKEKKDCERFKRNLKIIRQVTTANYQQFVNADCALIATLLVNMPTEWMYFGLLDFNEIGYTTPKKTAEYEGDIKNLEANKIKFIFINPQTDQAKAELFEKQLLFYHNAFAI